MKIELKRFHHSERLSQETNAFSADVWINGKKVGAAENAGHGGNTNVHITPRELREKVEAFCKPLLPAEYASFTSGVEWFIDELVTAIIKAKDDKRFAASIARSDKKSVVEFGGKGLGAARFRHKTEGAETWRWYGYKLGTDPVAGAKHLAAKHGVTIDEVVVL